MGPNVTTGLRNPAAWNTKTAIKLPESTLPATSEPASIVGVLTLSQDNSLIRRELCLDGLGGEVLSALPQVPLRTAKPAKAPEVRPIAPGCFGERILHAGELLRSDNKRPSQGRFLMSRRLMDVSYAWHGWPKRCQSLRTLHSSDNGRKRHHL